MGPKIQSVDRTSQATPYANDFLRILQGHLDSAFTTPTGTAGMTPGQSPVQMTNFQQKLGGINTAGSLVDSSPQLIEALTRRSAVTTDRNAAALREGHGALGNRFGSSLTRGEGLLRSESALNLDTIIGNILMEQAARQQAARQFDVQANLEAAAPFFQMASLGIIPNEIIASPGVGAQLLSGGLDFLGSFLGGGGKLPFFGGGGGGTGFDPSIAGKPVGPTSLPNFGNDPFANPYFGRG